MNEKSIDDILSFHTDKFSNKQNDSFMKMGNQSQKSIDNIYRQHQQSITSASNTINKLLNRSNSKQYSNKNKSEMQQIQQPSVQYGNNNISNFLNLSNKSNERKYYTVDSNTTFSQNDKTFRNFKKKIKQQDPDINETIQILEQDVSFQAQQQILKFLQNQNKEKKSVIQQIKQQVQKDITFDFAKFVQKTGFQVKQMKQYVEQYFSKSYYSKQGLNRVINYGQYWVGQSFIKQFCSQKIKKYITKITYKQYPKIQVTRKLNDPLTGIDLNQKKNILYINQKVMNMLSQIQNKPQQLFDRYLLAIYIVSKISSSSIAAFMLQTLKRANKLFYFGPFSLILLIMYNLTKKDIDKISNNQNQVKQVGINDFMFIDDTNQRMVQSLAKDISAGYPYIKQHGFERKKSRSVDVHLLLRFFPDLSKSQSSINRIKIKFDDLKKQQIKYNKKSDFYKKKVDQVIKIQQSQMIQQQQEKQINQLKKQVIQQHQSFIHKNQKFDYVNQKNLQKWEHNRTDLSNQQFYWMHQQLLFLFNGIKQTNFFADKKQLSVLPYQLIIEVLQIQKKAAIQKQKIMGSLQMAMQQLKLAYRDGIYEGSLIKTYFTSYYSQILNYIQQYQSYPQIQSLTIANKVENYKKNTLQISKTLANRLANYFTTNAKRVNNNIVDLRNQNFKENISPQLVNFQRNIVQQFNQARIERNQMFLNTLSKAQFVQGLQYLGQFMYNGFYQIFNKQMVSLKGQQITLNSIRSLEGNFIQNIQTLKKMLLQRQPDNQKIIDYLSEKWNTVLNHIGQQFANMYISNNSDLQNAVIQKNNAMKQISQGLQNQYEKSLVNLYSKLGDQTQYNQIANINKATLQDVMNNSSRNLNQILNRRNQQLTVNIQKNRQLSENNQIQNNRYIQKTIENNQKIKKQFNELYKILDNLGVKNKQIDNFIKQIQNSTQKLEKIKIPQNIQEIAKLITILQTSTDSLNDKRKLSQRDFDNFFEKSRQQQNDLIQNLAVILQKIEKNRQQIQGKNLQLNFHLLQSLQTVNQRNRQYQQQIKNLKQEINQKNKIIDRDSSQRQRINDIVIPSLQHAIIKLIQLIYIIHKQQFLYYKQLMTQLAQQLGIKQEDFKPIMIDMLRSIQQRIEKIEYLIPQIVRESTPENKDDLSLALLNIFKENKKKYDNDLQILQWQRKGKIVKI